MSRRIPPPMQLPEPAAYWQAATEGRLLVKLCTACGEYHHYPRDICPFCLSEATEWTTASAQGTVYSFSTLCARDAGYTTVLDAPLAANAIVVFQPGVQGASSYGHVAWVLSTQQRTDGRYITIVEHNWTGTGAVDHTRTIKDVVGMSYILAG